MKKWVKNTLTIGLCLIPIGLVVGFSNSWSNKTPISCVGSSGVKPFVENLAKEYQKNNKKLDITVEAGGSGFGIQQVAEGFANIGDASKDPYSAVQPAGDSGFRNQWIDRKIKTVTIGWEAICMVYIPPKGLNLTTDQLNNMLVVNNSNIQNFMRIFSGINEGITCPVTLGSFAKDPITISSKFNNTPLIPYVRAGGALTSGTAASFVNGTNLSEFANEEGLDPAQKNAFASGQYGTSFGIQQTDEANSRAWDMFQKSNKPGQVVYLSSGFVNQNLSLIKKNGYGIFMYDGASAASLTPVPYNIDAVDVPNGYNWFRPLNTILSVVDQTSPEIAFIKSLIVDANYVSKLESIGCKGLTPIEISEMFEDYNNHPDVINNPWVSDVDLKGSSWDWPTSGNFAPSPKGII